jgi:hypothetical protein
MPSIKPATWADLGYRKLPASGASLPGIQEALGRLSDYETSPDRNWVRRRARRKGARYPESIKVVATLDRETPLNDDCLSFTEEYVRSDWSRIEAGMRRIRADPDVLVETVKDASTCPDRWRGIYRLVEAMVLAGPERIRVMLRDHVVPCFFRWYPRGKIVVLRYGIELEAAVTVMRSLYTVTQAPQAQISQIKQIASKGTRTLEHWHFGSLTYLTPMVWDFFNYLFYPFIGGASICLAGLNFLLLFEPPEEHVPAPFPRN